MDINQKPVNLNSTNINNEKEVTLVERAKSILEWVYCVAIAIVLALLVRHFIGTPTVVKQPSMYPTLIDGQRLILNRWSRTVNSMPNRGDIITFESPTGVSEDITDVVAKYESEPKNVLSKFTYYVLEIGKTSYIKRVIGLPNDHVQIQDGKVYINGELLDEPYIDNQPITGPLGGDYTDIIVPEGCIYVLGDNRTQSSDSRRLGCIPMEKVESEVMIRFWPINKFGKVK